MANHILGCVLQWGQWVDIVPVVRYREVLRVTMVTHPVLLRGASQCYLLNSALCLMQVVRQPMC